MFVSTEMAGIRYYDYVVSVNNTPVASHVNLYEVRLLSPGHNIHKAEQIEVHVVYTTLSLSFSRSFSRSLTVSGVHGLPDCSRGDLGFGRLGHEGCSVAL